MRQGLLELKALIEDIERHLQARTKADVAAAGRKLRQASELASTLSIMLATRK